MVFSFSMFFVVVCTIVMCAVFLWAPEHLCDLGLDLGDELNERETTNNNNSIHFVLYGTGQDRIAFRHASAKPSRSVSTEEDRSSTFPPNLKFYHVLCPPRRAVPPRLRHASAEFENLFRSVSTEG